MSTADRLRWAAAATYAGIGFCALAAPTLVPRVFGGDAPTSESRTEVRAVYGGIPLGLALALTQAGRRNERAAGLTATVRYASYGMALARLLSSGYERRLKPWPTGFFIALELALGAALHPLPASEAAVRSSI